MLYRRVFLGVLHGSCTETPDLGGHFSRPTSASSRAPRKCFFPFYVMDSRVPQLEPLGES
jgi:hypothetical protein